MFPANRKRVKGLHTTGVGSVTCTRHNMWRLNGIGDLQLGERCVRRCMRVIASHFFCNSNV
jgi:hypothetical protein